MSPEKITSHEPTAVKRGSDTEIAGVIEELVQKKQKRNIEKKA